MKHKFALILSVVVVLVVTALLLTGSPLLSRSILGEDGMPLGTPLTWLGFICLPLIFLLAIPGLRKPKTRLQGWARKMFIGLLILGALWGMVSFALAGNWNFNFKRQPAFRGSARAGVLFWWLNYVLAIVPIMLLSFLSFEALIHKLRKRK